MAKSGVRAEVLDPTYALTAKQKVFVKALVKGKTVAQAAEIAGYSPSTARNTYKGVYVQAALKYLHKQHREAARVSRKKVVDGMLEAIEMAKEKNEPAVMIAGWREVGKICGFYAPEVKQINLNVTAKAVLTQMETMSDEELLKLVEKNEDVIEGEIVGEVEGEAGELGMGALEFIEDAA